MALMTKRERVMRTIRFEETDRVPLYDLLQSDETIEYYGGEKLTVENGDRVQGIAIGRTLDMTRGAGGPAEPGGLFRAEDGFVHRRERWQSWVIEAPFHDTPSMLEWVKGEIKRQNSITYGPDYRERMHRHVREHQAYFSAGDPTGRGDPTVLVLESEIGFTYMYAYMGLELFSYLMYDHPDLVEEWLEARLQRELRRVASMADPDLVPVVLTADDIAYKTAPLFSPAWLRKHWSPRLKQLNDAWHERNTICLFHSDGNLMPVMDDLIAAGIDGLNPLEVLAGMTVGGVRQRYPKLFLTGGIDVSQLLPLGTPEEVRAACRQAIAEADGRGYFLGSSTELHWGVGLDNARAMFETAWETAKR